MRLVRLGDGVGVRMHPTNVCDPQMLYGVQRSSAQQGTHIVTTTKMRKQTVHCDERIVGIHQGATVMTTSDSADRENLYWLHQRNPCWTKPRTGRCLTSFTGLGLQMARIALSRNWLRACPCNRFCKDIPMSASSPQSATPLSLAEVPNQRCEVALYGHLGEKRSTPRNRGFFASNC
jgi:hypothetical protein